ncbi:unnamed protein product [Staurois parvus]|uniref:Secreted protein n=1 Tax=Staurois parvus TaxID=386267 RepID=A0ABN9AAJ3_9NEOB|nr:unnamed protein product [Staurois parvus]
MASAVFLCVMSLSHPIPQWKFLRENEWPTFCVRLITTRSSWITVCRMWISQLQVDCSGTANWEEESSIPAPQTVLFVFAATQ